MQFKLSLLLFIMIKVDGQDPTVVLPQGRLVGIKVYPKDSLNSVEIYYGVPYAIAPTGRYRLSAPERHPGWRRTFFAHRMPPRCPQMGDSDKDFFNEDCLFLNIWTPRRADTKSLPVVVLLYSESWSESGAATLPCEGLAAKGVVVVTAAYRLHLLAFFTLKSVLARGNLALLDQYLALLWVRENIAAFGGDPNSITLMGHSAGADSVLHHLSSQRSYGLFQKAIVMSPRYIWRAIDDDNLNISEDLVKVSREMALQMGCTGSDDEIMQCMRDRPITDIIRTYSADKNSNWSKAIQPIPDVFLPESEQYLPHSVARALSATGQPTLQLDILLGAVDLEAIHFNDDDYEDLSQRGVSYIMDYTNKKIIPELLSTLSLQNSELHPMLTEAVRWEFWGGNAHSGNDKLDGVKAVESLARAQSSQQWAAGTALLSARFARRVSRLYVYSFTQTAGVDLRGHRFNFTGAVHGSDLVALLGDALLLQVSRRPPTAEEQRVTTLFRRYIVNFIKFGSPTTGNEWPRYKAGEAYVQEIPDEGTRGPRQGPRHVAFWLQYLPQLSALLEPENTEQLILSAGESRLRGGVVALCAVSAALLALLCACAALLRWERARRLTHNYDAQ